MWKEIQANHIRMVGKQAYAEHRDNRLSPDEIQRAEQYRSRLQTVFYSPYRVPIFALDLICLVADVEPEPDEEGSYQLQTNIVSREGVVMEETVFPILINARGLIIKSLGGVLQEAGYLARVTEKDLALAAASAKTVS